jgi:prepilin-type N-terminal cleavage/methylation domain-containing protein
MVSKSWHGNQGVSRRGFTLIELLAVMGIMILLMTISVTGMRGMRRGSEIRGAVNSVRSTLMLARQQAVTKRCKVMVCFVKLGSTVTTNQLEIYSVSGGTSNLIHGVVVLSPAIEFKGSPANIVFTPSGAAAGSLSPVTVYLGEKSGSLSNSLTVWPLTGVTRTD